MLSKSHALVDVLRDYAEMLHELIATASQQGEPVALKAGIAHNIARALELAADDMADWEEVAALKERIAHLEAASGDRG